MKWILTILSIKIITRRLIKKIITLISIKNNYSKINEINNKSTINKEITIRWLKQLINLLLIEIFTSR